MSIHSEIKRLRLAKGWSHATLAEEITKAEQRAQPLAWQTIQQWEREPSASTTKKSTAPSRRRLEIVAALLGTTPAALLAGQPPQDTSIGPISGSEGMLIAYFRMLDPDARQALILTAKERAATYAVAQDKRQDAA